MACPTCRRTDVQDTCGTEEIGKECRCCGKIIIARADPEVEGQPEEVADDEQLRNL